MNDLLTRIVDLAETLAKQKDELAALEAATKEAKRAMLETEREDLPALMGEAGLTEIKLSDGRRVTLKEDVDAKITDATRAAALSWLLENDFGGLIKTNVSIGFGRGDHDEAMQVRNELAGRYAGVELKEDVHPSTLKAFIRERLQAGEKIPMDLFNVYPYSKAVIK